MFFYPHWLPADLQAWPRLHRFVERSNIDVFSSFYCSIESRRFARGNLLNAYCCDSIMNTLCPSNFSRVRLKTAPVALKALMSNTLIAMSPETLLFSDTPDGFFAWLESPAGDADALGDDGLTPLWVLAVEKRHTLGLAMLMSKGAHVAENTRFIKDRQLDALLLLLLTQIGHAEMFQAVLEAGISANATARMGPIPVPNFLLARIDQKMVDTPVLQLVVENPDSALVTQLLIHGAMVDATDSEGNTALHIAATRLAMTSDGNFPMIDALLLYGADRTIKNRQGYTASEYLTVYLTQVHPEAMDTPMYTKVKDLITPAGQASSIILLR